MRLYKTGRWVVLDEGVGDLPVIESICEFTSRRVTLAIGRKVVDKLGLFRRNPLCVSCQSG